MPQDGEEIPLYTDIDAEMTRGQKAISLVDKMYRLYMAKKATNLLMEAAEKRLYAEMGFLFIAENKEKDRSTEKYIYPTKEDTDKTMDRLKEEILPQLMKFVSVVTGEDIEYKTDEEEAKERAEKASGIGDAMEKNGIF